MDLPDQYHLWRPADLGPDTVARAACRVAILLLPQASLANVCAVFEDLAAVNFLPDTDQDRPRFAARILAEGGAPFTSLSGATLTPHGGLDDGARFDAVVLPTLYDDGTLSRVDAGPILSAGERGWLSGQHAHGAVFSTMCSGAYALAESGLVDGHGVAMHPLYAKAFRARFPEVPAETRKGLVVSGDRREFITGGFSTYSADVSLYLIARFFGADVALSFGRLYQKDWSEALPVAPEASGPVADGTGTVGTGAVGTGTDTGADLTIRLAQRFMLSHLDRPGLVGAAAAMAHLDERTFTRRFERATGLKPRDFVLRQRLRRAQELLSRSRLPIQDVAAKVGYRDRSAFAKAFKIHTEETPAQYRARTQAPTHLMQADLAGT